MPDNPFNAMLDPSKQGTISGFIGGLMGNPTQQQATGSITGKALSELGALRDQGLSPQQALLKFFQTPTGQDFFSNAGPDGLKTLTDSLTATQPPVPTMHNLAPGAQLYQQSPTSGKIDLVASNPKDTSENTPADVRSFNYFTQLAQLPTAEIRRLAALKADPTKDPNSVTAVAIDKMVKDYGLDPRLAESMKAGQVKVLPLKNEMGQDTGAVSIVDLTSPGGASVQVLNPGVRGPAPTATGTNPSAVPPIGGTNPSNGAATGVLPPADNATPPTKVSDIPKNNPKYFGDKASMFLASGPIASGLQGASAVSEMVNPKLIIPEGAKSADRQQLIDTLRSDLSAMGQMGEGWVNKGVLEGYLKLAPTGGLTESPHQAIQKAIRLSEHIQSEIDAQAEVYSDARLPLEQRKKAQAIIQGWQRVQRDLPTPDELTTMEKSIREGTAGTPTVSSAIDAVSKAAGKAITEVKKEGAAAAQQQGITSPAIETMSDSDLIKLDPKTLDRQSKIKLLRRLDALRGNRGSAVAR